MPVPDVAAEVHAALKPRKGRFADAVAAELGRLRGVRVTRADFDLARLPPHLRMTFRVEDEHGAVVAEGTDLAALRERARPRLREELASAARGLEAHGLTAWTIGELPRTVALPGTGQAVRGYPALVDEGESAGVRVLETPGAQARGDGRRHAPAAAARRPVAGPRRPGRPRATRSGSRWRARRTRASAPCSPTPRRRRSTR